VNVRIVTDSASDLPQAVVDELGIGMVPLTIRIGDREYVDRRDLTPRQFWDLCAATPTLPETAAPAPGQFEAEYRRLFAEGADVVVVVSLSGALSATMQSAELAARSFPDGAVRVIDSRSVSLGQGLVAAECARLAATGASADEVVALAHSLVARTEVWGALDTLDNLKKGGRIGGARALLASALAIKPIIEVRDGKVEQGGKQRTRTKALAFLVDTLRNGGEIEHLYVLHADCDDAAAFVAMLQPYAPEPIVVGDIGPVVGTHAGRGTIGIGFTRRAMP
jgi:DegV family protein with EDD domain